MMTRIKHLLKHDSGAAAVEFALIGPILALIVVGMIDIGLYANEKIKIQSLSRQAAEFVVRGGAEANVEEAIFETSDLYTSAPGNRTSLQFSGDTVCECANGIEALSCTDVCPDNSDYLRSFYEATITAVYTPLLPYPGIADGVTLTGYSKLQYTR